MMKKRLSKKIWYGSDVDTEGNPVLPPLAIDSDDLEGLHYGELYLHIADDKLSLWTRTLTDQVKQIGGSGSGDGELWQLRQTDAGEPYLFSPFDVAVQRGLTSFVDGGSLDLPSIYDGLPIDNQTLYWKEVTEQVGTDEEGNPIYEPTKVLKAQGGGSGGGVADSVHWDNIQGKPDFSQYVTSDALNGYLPLSGGTMTGQINMPVGIGNAIKFGEESRLFASNGNFYISAETHLIFASGASGNNVPNNAVIDKTGRMFIANNLVVGRSSFITDSYKLNVAGDAYVNGNLVVSGTIYPSMSSFHNIGDPSKRFACVYADSVDVGGIKISLLQDGVLLIDGNLAVTGGITSYVDGGDLDLPSIYDGLPIDGDTLYWVLDDNGKKVMLKSKGGNDEGGGTVQYPLTWSGFSNGSWDGSVAMTIAIPSKLSDLENDGFFKDYGWAQGDANEKKFGSHFLSGAVDNIPISNGQLLAFNGADGAQFFVWENHFYHRQNWGGGWHGWRKVISGDSNGVIDYDLTLGGSLNMPSGYSQIKCGENALLESYGGSSDTYLSGNEHLYLISKNIFAYEGSEEIYRILHEGNYRNFEYTAKRLSVVDIRNTTPKPSDIETFAVTAQFTNADNPKGGWYSGFSVQGWTNDYKAWQLRSGAESSADNHLYFRNGELETWNDWRRVITGDVNGVLDFNLELKGEEGGNIKFVYNSDSAITTNKPNEIASIRHALRFPWWGEAYEIGTVRGNASHSDGFGITHQNNHLVWKVNREQMDVYGDLRLKGGLIQYNEEKGYFYLEGNLVVSGGITSYVDVGNLNLPSIYDGLPLDMDTLGWKEVTDASGAKSKVLSVIGGIDESILWSDIEGIPSWIGSSKPSYSYSEINGTPDLTKYAQKTEIPSLSGYATQAWVEKQGYAKSSDIPNLDGYAKLTHLSDYLPLSGGTIDGTLNIKVNGTAYECLTAANVNPKSSSSVAPKIYTPKGIGNNGQILVVKNQGMGWRDASEIKAGGLTVTNKKAWGQTYWTSSGIPTTIDGDMTDVGSITPKTNAASDIGSTGAGFRDAYVQRVRVNGGWLSYNASQGYFELDGNLLVTGGITAFADSGAGNQWIMDAKSLEEVVSDNPFKVYSAKVVSMIASKITKIEEVEGGVKEALDKLEIITVGLSSLTSNSSTIQVRDALTTISFNLNNYVRDTE